MKVMFQFQHPGGKPTLAVVQEKYGFRPEEVDQKYGVALVDPQDSSYVIRVDEEASKRFSTTSSKSETTGFYSEVKIQPFGPPRR